MLRRAALCAGLAATIALGAATSANATGIYTVRGGCVVVNSAAQGPEAACKFDATTSLGYSGDTDTGYALFHYERVPVFDDRGCARTAADGSLETRDAKVYDVDSHSAGPFAAQANFFAGVTYTAVIRGTGEMSAGNVDPSGAGGEPAQDTPLDRTQDVAPGQCVSDFSSQVGTTSNGLELEGYQQLDGRLAELTFQTSQVSGETRVRVLTPTGYDRSGKTRYPVLFLLHGALDNQTAWTVKGQAEQITARYPVIVVMPDSGTGDGYVDWYNGGAYGPPAWETYHLTQLLPWIDGHYPTVGKRSGRVLAGLSMGGYGTMEYAARHPDLFVAAEAFSGAVDITNPFLRAEGEPAALSGSSGYGEWATNEVYIRGRNPTDLAPNLDGLWLALRTGDGTPGGPDPSGLPVDPVEMDVYQQNISMHNRLNELGLPHVWDYYGAGSHSWYYWERDLQLAMPDFMGTLGSPTAPPSPFTYRSIDSSYDVYGWRVAVQRPAWEFSELRHASSAGFELLGSGSGTVTTAGYFKRKSTVRATVRSIQGTTVETLVADESGRVKLSVPLGPGNVYQEYSPEAKAADAVYGTQLGTGTYVAGSPGTAVYTTRVDLSGPLR